MNTFEAINVIITRESQEDPYEIHALNAAGKSQTFEAGALNLNGYAFATSGLDMGEYGRTITVEQEEGSRYLNLKLEN